MRSRNFLFPAFIILALASMFFIRPQESWAHSFGYAAIKTDLTAQKNNIILHTEVPQQIAADAPDKAGQMKLWEEYFSENFSVRQTKQDCPFTLTAFDASDPARSVFDGVFACPASVLKLDDLTIHTVLFQDFFQNYNHFVTFSLRGTAWNLVFSPDNQNYPETVTAVQGSGDTPTQQPQQSQGAAQNTNSPAATTPQAPTNSAFQQFFAIAKQFVWLGMLHIWTGYDHILFLLSVILLLRSVKKILKLVTSFTIAHSITLLLAGFGIITLSPRIVEPLIALSIAYMAVRNIMALRKNQEGLPSVALAKEDGQLSERWATTFGFGLVHGLGFAGALRDAQIPQAFFVPSLVIFNGGIEIGQLCILALAIPALFEIDALRSRRNILLAGSAAITALALFWFSQRIM